jgi:hypothetical protein
VYHGRLARVYHGRLAHVLLLKNATEEETDTAKMAVVHTGRMPVLRVVKQLLNGERLRIVPIFAGRQQ